MDNGRSHEEIRDRGLGVVVALAAMAAASFSIRWPAPGSSVALGLAVYLIARGSGDRRNQNDA